MIQGCLRKCQESLSSMYSSITFQIQMLTREYKHWFDCIIKCSQCTKFQQFTCDIYSLISLFDFFSTKRLHQFSLMTLITSIFRPGFFVHIVGRSNPKFWFPTKRRFPLICILKTNGKLHDKFELRNKLYTYTEHRMRG